MVTPKRPDATCLMAERRQSPFGSRSKRRGSSPPSPVFDLPPIRFIAIASVSCASVESERLARENVEADPADPRGGVREVAVDQLALEPDRLEDLRARVAPDRGNPHLGDRLEDPLAHRLDEVGVGLSRRLDLRQTPAV